VYTSAWEHIESSDPQHVSLATACDAAVVAPCTMDCAGKLATGRTDDAAQLFGESLDIWTEAGDKSGMVLLVSAISTLAGARGRPERRWRLIGAVERLRVETGTDLVNQDIELLGWRPMSDPETDEERAWFESGRALSMDDALALARAEVAGDP